MHRCGGGQHVARVREGREGGHVAGQGGGAEGAALVHQAFGEVVHAVLRLFALLGLAGHLPVPGLDAFLLHGQRSVDLLSKGDREDGRLVFCCERPAGHTMSAVATPTNGGWDDGFLKRRKFENKQNNWSRIMSQRCWWRR